MSKELGSAVAGTMRLSPIPLQPVPFSPHAVQFYENDSFLAGVVARFIAEGLAAGEPVVLIATSNHLEAFQLRAKELGADVAAAVDSGRIVLLDAHVTLASLMVGDLPDAGRFATVIGGAIARSAATAGGRRVRAYGEMVEVLWRGRNPTAAIRLEQLWNDLASHHSFSLLCAYSLAAFDEPESSAGFADVCAAHHQVHPAEGFSPADDDALRREFSRLQQRAAALGSEIAHRERVERALRQSREELVDFVENATVALHWVGADGRILWANRAELSLLGYTLDEYVGRPISDFHVDRDVIDDILARLERNETLREYPARMRRKDGTIRHVVIDSNVLRRDGVFVHTRCFTRDVTAQVDAQVERASRERLRELFIGMLGHDLRNPLGAIRTGADVLAMRGGRNNGERLDHASATIVARISRSADRMARMIDHVLDFARLNAGNGIPLVVHPADLSSACAAVVDELHTAHPDRAFEVKYLGSSAGMWDLDRLSQVFSNLIGNAVAYGDPGEPIRVLVEGEPDWVVVRVHNMGPPIRPEVLPTIFEPFRRAREKAAGDRGLGLGLYITKEIVEGHGGTIDVRSRAESGTTFCVRLPRRFSPTPQATLQAELPRPEESSRRAEPRARVLIVEDDEDSAEVINEALTSLGHDVCIVREGSLALTEAKQFAPDVVLLDVMLPGMDGVEVARRLRQVCRARIVGVSGAAPAAANAAEFDAYLVKPVNVAALTRAIAAAGQGTQDGC
jgi:PAS domain S-box-containing protein